jgi:eukaryotic-like serine/threonine-protein kinase
MSQQPEWSDHPTRAETGVAELPSIPGYELTGELGRGGMGVVYSATQTSSGQPVAVKVIRDGALAGPRELARFRIEAEAAARMRHPNFVHILEVGEHSGRPFLVMERVDGHNLAEHLGGQPQPPRTAAELVRTLAHAIAHAHERKVVHRDLKPENVLLSGDIPKITDFGLAKRLDTESTAWTQAGAVIGTPAYMAPEQAAGRVSEIGPAADIYALGVLLYEMLTGRPPFAAESWDRMVQQVLNADPTPPSAVLADVPADLETICLKCLEKEIEKRYATAAELADDLDRFLTGVPVVAVPPTSGERLARAADRDGYRLVAEIGRGPQSVVYHARYGPLDQPVAVKVFPAGFCTADEWTTRLRCGSGALAALNHPHVLSVRQAVWWDNRPCLISEFVPQGSLATQIGGRLAPVRDSVRLVIRLAELVGYLHRQGAVHGNLKPTNVLMAADGIPRVADPYLMSGLFQCPLPMSAKDPAALARVAPEFVRDPKDEPRPYTDVYGLGMILYELLTGRQPFAAETAEEACEQVLTREPIPPSRLNPQVPQPLDWIVSRCLQKDRWQRYPRAYDLLTRLRKAIDDPNASGERSVPRRGSGLEGVE